MIALVSQDVAAGNGVLQYVYLFLVSATGLALVQGGVRAARKFFGGASMRAKDVYSQMQTQRDEALDEAELVKAERDQANRRIARRDRVIIVDLGWKPDQLIELDGADQPYVPPPRAPKKRAPRRKPDDDPSA